MVWPLASVMARPLPAREKLNEFWTEISRAGELYSPLRTLPWERWLQMYGVQADFSPTYHAFQLMTHMFSPYQLNPSGSNALAPILDKEIDFKRLQNSPIKVFVTATNVRTGRPRVFRNADITPEVLMASACLPTLDRASRVSCTTSEATDASSEATVGSTSTTVTTSDRASNSEPSSRSA